MEDYPANMMAFEKRFDSEQACLDYVAQVMPRVHLVASLLKRWLLGTHQGAVSQEHLQAYLEEFCFRFNRRSSRSRGKLFFRIMEQAVRHRPLPYAKIIKHSRPFHRPKNMSS